MHELRKDGWKRYLLAAVLRVSKMKVNGYGFAQKLTRLSHEMCSGSMLRRWNMFLRIFPPSQTGKLIDITNSSPNDSFLRLWLRGRDGVSVRVSIAVKSVLTQFWCSVYESAQYPQLAFYVPLLEHPLRFAVSRSLEGGSD